MRKLHISDDLSLPIEFVTQTQAILARKRVGKSYTASVQAEEMLKRKQQVLVIDYTGAWWGLRAGRDGKPDGGYPIHVFGGDHADVPLEERAGEVIATAAVKERFSAILDMSSFRKAEALRFLAPFLETLYRLNREPLHLFADEADAYAPQRTFAGDDARTLGAMNDIVLRGGIRGIGCTLITQRSARINKDVLSQCGILTCLRISSPKDMAPIKEWVEVHDEGSQSAELMRSLPTLPIGTAWMWAPGWPTEAGIFERLKVREWETFDSGATPKPGQTVKAPKSLRPVDLARLGESIKETAEKAKANDPAELRRKIAELEKAAAKPAPPAKVQEPVEKRVEVPVLRDGQLARVEKAIDRLHEIATKTLTEAAELLGVVRPTLAPAKAPATVRPDAFAPIKPFVRAEGVKPVRQKKASASPSAEGVTPRQQRMLNAAATLTMLQVEVSRETVCGWLGIHPRGGSVGQELSALAEAGLIAVDRGRIDVTDAGQQAAELLDPAQAIEQAKSGLSPRQARIFEILVDTYPDSTTRDAIAEAMGIHPRGGSFGEDLGRLKSRGLVEGERGVVRARDFLFAGGKA